MVETAKIYTTYKTSVCNVNKKISIHIAVFTMARAKKALLDVLTNETDESQKRFILNNRLIQIRTNNTYKAN